MKTLFFALISFMTLPALAMTADEIMQKVDQAVEPMSMQSDMTMVLVDNKGNQRLRAMQSVSATLESIDKSLMFFLEPSDVRGTGFLMFDYEDAGADDDQWMLLPSLGKAKRIASGDKTGSFMGSDFTFADMSKRNIEEWTYSLLKEDEISGIKVWVIESIPVNESVIQKTGYTKTIAYVRQDNFKITRAISYLQKQGDVKLMNVGSFVEVGGYWLAAETQMVSQKNGQTVHRTLMKLENIQVDFDVNPSDFTLTRLEQGL